MLDDESQIDRFDNELLTTNLVGATTLEQLQQREKIITLRKELYLRSNPINGNLDYEYLKAIHKYLFSDIYTWAGQDRYEIGLFDIFRKGNTYFTRGDLLPSVSKVLFDELKNENYFLNLQYNEYIKSLAIFMNGLNILHPFREGNGRVQRIFIEQLALKAGYRLDLSQIDKDMIIQASIQGVKGNTINFEIILKNNIQH
jgi:cell filamentation protein